MGSRTCLARERRQGMLIIIKVKATDNIIGLKEDIAARLEDVADIERIDVESEESNNGQKK
jgi:hypothetical protein